MGRHLFQSAQKPRSIWEAIGKLGEVQTIFEIDAWLLQFQNQPVRRLEKVTLILISLVGALGDVNQLGSQFWQDRLADGLSGYLHTPIRSVTVRFLTLNKWPLACVFSERW